MPKRGANACRPSSFVVARVRGASPMGRMPEMAWMPATSSSTTPGATRRLRCQLLANSRPPRTATEQTSQTAL